MRATERSIERSQEFLIVDKLTSRFVPYLDYFCRNPVKLHYWKSINLAVTDMDLPPSLLAPFKRELGDDVHSLKYVIFQLNHKGNHSHESGRVDEILGIIDSAKRYNLNQNEFQTACRMFLQNSAMKEILNHDVANQTKPIQRRCKTALLPMPKIGTTLYRKDPRRKGSCKVVEIEQIRCTVVWQHSGKRSSVLLGNIRSPALYSLEVVR